MRYRAFRTKKDNQFYFQFLTDAGETVLRSQPYADKDSCFNGIRSVIQNAGDATRYSKLEENGQHYFILKAGNNQEIGRSIAYDSEAAVDQGIALMMAEGPNAAKNNAIAAEANEANEANEAKTTESTTTESTTTTTTTTTTTESAPQPASSGNSSGKDDYRPLAFYEARIAGTENGFDTFHDEEGGEYYFTYNVGQLVLLISEGYASDKGRDNGVNSVTKNLPIPERYKKGVHENGKHYFSLRAGNNQEITTSRWFDTEGEMDRYITALQGGKEAINALVASMRVGEDGRLYKDYKPLGFYEERIEGTPFGYDTFAEEDKSYFTINYDGAPLLISEDYNSEAGRDNGIKSVKKNVKNEKR
ncbi:MAG: YegP family protein, partial [Bacteroidota bacterium]